MANQKEVWKPIPEYEGIYEVSNLGKIRSLDRNVGKWKKYYITGKLLKPRILPTGYQQIDLYKDGKIKKARIHRLVAEAFIPNPYGKPYVNHIDGNKQNNSTNNLEWCTQSENIKHAYDMNLMHCPSGEENYQAKFTNAQAHKIREEYIPRDKEYGINALARKCKVSPMSIWKIIHNKTYK